MPPTTMLDKILFWVVLVWMVALLVMAFRAVREVWKEDSQEPIEPERAGTAATNAQESAKPDSPGTENPAQPSAHDHVPPRQAG